MKAKSSEAKSNLVAIRASQLAYFVKWESFVVGQPLTPVADRTGNSNKLEWNSDTRFSIIGFAPEGKVFYSYGLEEGNPTSGFKAYAVGDLDKNGKISTYTITDESEEIIHSGDVF